MAKKDPPRPISCDEEGVIPSSLSVTVRGAFDDTKAAAVWFGFFRNHRFDVDEYIEVDPPTQIEYDRIKVPVRILQPADSDAAPWERGKRYVLVEQRGQDGISETAIFQIRQGEE
jgi:hypothetical protein